MNSSFCTLGPLTSKKEAKGIRHEIRTYKKRSRIILTVVTFAILLSIIATIFHYTMNYYGDSNPTTEEPNGHSNGDSFEAALVDALYANHPNDQFTQDINFTLQEIGFTVDIYQGSEVNVELLKNLKSRYRLIIFRMHSALSANNDLYLFTAEPYMIGKYTQEQSFQLIKEAYATNSSSPVFAVNWGFIKQCMKGKFNGTLVIAMGCDGAKDEFLAQEFTNQGAVAYVSWTGPVMLSHSDQATLYLIKALYVEGLTLEQAVDKTNSQVGADPYWSSVLDCYL